MSEGGSDCNFFFTLVSCTVHADYRLNSPSTSAISLEVMGHRLHISQVRRTGEAPDESRFLKRFFF